MEGLELLAVEGGKSVLLLLSMTIRIVVAIAIVAGAVNYSIPPKSLASRACSFSPLVLLPSLPQPISICVLCSIPVPRPSHSKGYLAEASLIVP